MRGSRGELNKGAYGAVIGGVRAAAPAVLVQAIGHFTRTRPGIVPKGGSPTMTGTAISLIIDDETAQTLDQSFGARPIDLAHWVPSPISCGKPHE